MGIELAKAYLTVRADSSKLGSDLGSVRSTFSSMGYDVQRSLSSLATQAGVVGGFMASAGMKLFSYMERSVAAVKNFVSNGMEMAGIAEQNQIAFETMLGSASEASDTFARLTEFAAKTPFEMPEITQAARGLIQFGERGDELMKTLRMVGDAAAGTSTPFGFLALVFNQVRGVGKLMTQDFRQLSTRGVLSLQDIAKHYGVTTEAANKMLSQGRVSFEDFKKIMASLSGEGGRFENMMERQSRSYLGLWSTMKDNVNLAARALGERLLPAAKAVTETLNEGFEWLGETIKDNAETFDLAVTGFIETLSALVDAAKGAKDFYDWYSGKDKSKAPSGKRRTKEEETAWLKRSVESDEKLLASREKSLKRLEDQVLAGAKAGKPDASAVYGKEMTEDQIKRLRASIREHKAKLEALTGGATAEAPGTEAEAFRKGLLTGAEKLAAKEYEVISEQIEFLRQRAEDGGRTVDTFTGRMYLLAQYSREGVVKALGRVKSVMTSLKPTAEEAAKAMALMQTDLEEVARSGLITPEEGLRALEEYKKSLKDSLGYTDAEKAQRSLENYRNRVSATTEAIQDFTREHQGAPNAIRQFMEAMKGKQIEEYRRNLEDMTRQIDDLRNRRTSVESEILKWEREHPEEEAADKGGYRRKRKELERAELAAQYAEQYKAPAQKGMEEYWKIMEARRGGLGREETVAALKALRDQFTEKVGAAGSRMGAADFGRRIQEAILGQDAKQRDDRRDALLQTVNGSIKALDGSVQKIKPGMG